MSIDNINKRSNPSENPPIKRVRVDAQRDDVLSLDQEREINLNNRIEEVTN
jgi:hypothetical protein